MSKLTAIIPARQFDYNLKNKNLLPFLDTNLLVHKIRQLKATKQVDTILVCSDSEEVLKQAVENGAEVFKRQTETEGMDTFSHLIKIVLSQLSAEHILWTNCCTPFVDETIYAKAIEMYFKKRGEGYDSLISTLPFKRFVLDDNGALNFRRGGQHKETNKLNTLYFWISAIAIAKREDMLAWEYTWGNITFKYNLNEKESLEIKNAEDLKLAQLYLGE